MTVSCRAPARAYHRPAMGYLRRHLRVGWLYLVQAVKTRLEYRADFLMECLAALLQQAAGLLVLAFLFEKIEILQDWRREEVFFIYGFGLLPRALFDAFAMNFYMFSDRYLVQGEMDRLLLRPLSSLFQMLMEGISFDFLADLTLGIAVVTYASSKLGLVWTWESGLALGALVLGAWGVLMGVFLSLTALSFWSQERVGLIPPVYNLLNFAQYPLTIFNKLVSVLLTFVIPFGFVAYYPSTAFLKDGLFSELAWYTPAGGAALPGRGRAALARGAAQVFGRGKLNRTRTGATAVPRLPSSRPGVLRRLRESRAARSWRGCGNRPSRRGGRAAGAGRRIRARPSR
ncbi:MAG: ABC-2 family transporter protein [Planctomycetota bacterium]|nr:ABC-2 family transporter protein [Planctomycetota bacterium]